MGFKYKKFEVRTGEVVEPTRIRQNMQTLAHEINGNLDRENLPEKGIEPEVIEYETFNAIETDGSSAHFDMKDKGVQFVEVMSITLDVPVDCVVVAHFGCYFTWHLDDSSKLDGYLGGTTISTNWGNFFLICTTMMRFRSTLQTFVYVSKEKMFVRPSATLLCVRHKALI